MSNQAMQYTPTIREQIGWRLFPAQHCDIPDMPMSDCLVVVTTTDLSFLDRLRVLVSGRVRVTTKTATEGIVGDYATNAVFNVQPPRWLSRGKDD